MKKLTRVLVLTSALISLPAFAEKGVGKGERYKERRQAMTECAKTIGLTLPEDGSKREFMSNLTDEQRDAFHSCMKDKGFAKGNGRGKGKECKD